MQNVEFAEWPARKFKLGVVCLENPKALNSLTLDMVQAIALRLERWQNDPEIAAVVFFSSLERAFCAGGDVKTVAQKLFAKDSTGYAADFFKWEYKMDYMIQTYSKPILVWGDGIVMGGGMGIFCGASHGVVTERTVMAMPEIAIGFFPDVGAGYFLNKLPRATALFLAWTGARLNSADAVSLGFACAEVSSLKRTALFAALRDAEWSASTDTNKSEMSKVVAQFKVAPTSLSMVDRNRETIEKIFAGDDAAQIVKVFLELKTEEPWLLNAQKEFRYGSPLSMRVSQEQLRRAKTMNVLDVFVMEWSLARQMGDRHEFKEGVRARLIDKDNKPVWKPARIEDISDAEVAAHFAPYAGEAEIREFFRGSQRRF